MKNVIIISLYIFICSQLMAQELKNEISARPNILIIMADDCTYNDLSVYGGTNVKTPNIDNLASNGLVFDKAFVTMSMCVPCRAELHTGRYPMNNGVCWNHSPARVGIRGSGQYLKSLGYRVGLAGKAHLNPPEVYQFEKLEVADAYQNLEEISKFISRDENPFFLTVGSHMPHAPWTFGDSTHFNPQTIQLPSYIADTKESRSDFCKYLAEIEFLDYQIGRVLDVLEKSGKAKNTIVIVTSEQGSQWPGCKWTNWNPGLHTGLIVKWPGMVSAGKRTDAVVQYVDVLPTLLEMAGDNSVKKEFDGRSFLPVLQGKTQKHREYAYFMHNNIPEGPSYPIRAITDGTYQYIRNLKPDNMYIEKHLMGQATWHQYWLSWIFEAADNEHTSMLVNRYMHRPAEELYNSVADPENMHNLISEEQYSGINNQLSSALDLWMKEQRDPGAILDSWEYYKANRSRRPIH